MRVRRGERKNNRKKEITTHTILTPPLSPSFEFEVPTDCLQFAQWYYKNKTETPAKKNRPSIKATTTTTTTTTKSKFQIALDSLPAKEQEAAMKYRNMLKNKVPEPAIRHKITMEGNGKLESIVFMDDDSTSTLAAPTTSTTFTSAPTASPANNISPEDEEKLSKYRKMLKMKLPQAAVVHKMKMESIDQRLICLLFPTEAQATPIPSKPVPLTASEEVAIKKYKAMLKMNVPEAAVLHKMKMEDVETKLIEYMFPEEAKASASAVVAEPVKLSEEEVRIK